jgi:hypothetical protein
MDQLHSVYQALKAATDKLYAGVDSKQQERYLEDIRSTLDDTLKSLEDKLGITDATKEGEDRKAAEDVPANEAVNIGAPTKINVAPGDRRAPEVPVTSGTPAEDKVKVTK